MITRKDYLDNAELHHDYYLQFATQDTYRIVRERFDIALLLRMYAENGNFNSYGLPNGIQRPDLKAWDRLCQPLFFDRDKMRKAGEMLTVNTMVCTLKAVATDIVIDIVLETILNIANIHRDKIEDDEEISAAEFAKRIKEAAEYGKQSYANIHADVVTIHGGYWTNEIKGVVHTWDSVIVPEIG